MEDSYTCHKCSMRLKYKQNVIRHEKVCGNLTKSGEIQNRTCTTCPKCKLIFSRIEHLRLHVATAHGIPQEEEQFKFLTKKDFEVWKKWIEKENRCFYSKKRTSMEKGIKRNYFYCHRSGFFESKSTGVRRLKKQGTNKIDATCTSTMIVTEYAGYFEVTFYKTHFGHDCRPPMEYPKTKKRSRIANTHNYAKKPPVNEMDSDDIVKTSEKAWEIPSNNRENVTYEVILVSDSCFKDLPEPHDDVDKNNQKIQEIIHQLDTAKDILITNEYTAEELSVIQKEANNLMDLITKNMTKS